MEIVIKLTEEDFKKVQDGRAAVTVMRNAIRNGKVLSKGHGELKDIGNIRLDKFVRIENFSLNPRFSVEFKKGYNAAIDDALYVLMSAPVLIEADEEGAEE